MCCNLNMCFTRLTASTWQNDQTRYHTNRICRTKKKLFRLNFSGPFLAWQGWLISNFNIQNKNKKNEKTPSVTSGSSITLNSHSKFCGCSPICLTFGLLLAQFVWTSAALLWSFLHPGLTRTDILTFSHESDFGYAAAHCTKVLCSSLIPDPE